VRGGVLTPFPIFYEPSVEKLNGMNDTRIDKNPGSVGLQPGPTQRVSNCDLKGGSLGVLRYVTKTKRGRSAGRVGIGYPICPESPPNSVH
jgi:hypothetical protein